MTFYCPKSALAHPIRENRLLAIQALGDLRSPSALVEFTRILRDEEDYYVLRETLTALAKINTAESRALILEATQNPSRLVRNFARERMSKEPVV